MSAQNLPALGCAKQVAHALGIHRATLHAWVSKGQFPQPIRLSARRVVWPWSVVREWLDRQAEQVPA